MRRFIPTRAACLLATVAVLTAPGIALSLGGGRGMHGGGQTLRGTGVLTGTVRDGSGKPLAKVMITLSSGTAPGAFPADESKNASMFSDENGKYSFPRARAGDLTLSAKMLGALDFAANVTITAGQTTTFDVVMSSFGTH